MRDVAVTAALRTKTGGVVAPALVCLTRGLSTWLCYRTRVTSSLPTRHLSSSSDSSAQEPPSARRVTDTSGSRPRAQASPSSVPSSAAPASAPLSSHAEATWQLPEGTSENTDVELDQLQSPIPQPPAGPRPRVWPYNRSERLPFPAPDAVKFVPRDEVADWDLMRNDEVVQQFINNFFRHGRKAQYTAFLSRAFFLIHQRTGENPLTIFHKAIDSVTPIMSICRQTRGVRSVEVPYPLSPRQGRRIAIVWIMHAADRRKEMHIEDRLAGELLNIWKGVSTVNKEKIRLHKQCLMQRANARIRLV